jgi:hypothetical protein
MEPPLGILVVTFAGEPELATRARTHRRDAFGRNILAVTDEFALASKYVSLAVIRENDDPRSDKSCPPAETPAGLNGFDDGEEAKPVINRFGDPTVLRRNVAEANVSMPIRHRMFVAWFSALAGEHERLARSEVLIRIAAKLDPGGRFTSQLCYPTRVGPYALLLEQC